MNEHDGAKDVFTLSQAEKIRLGLKKPPRGPLTTTVVYPVHVSSRAMYYKTEKIAKGELAQWILEHPGLVVIGRANNADGGTENRVR